MMGMASTVTWLLLSRIPVGLFKQTVTISQAYLTDLTSEDERVTYVSYLSSMTDLGFILGPSIASIITLYWNYTAACVIASLIFSIDLVLVYFLLPVVPPRRKKDDRPQRLSLPLPSSPFLLQFSSSTCWIWIYFVCLLPQMMLTLFFPKYTQMQYNVAAHTNAFLQSYLSTLSMTTQLFGIPIMLTKSKESSIFVLSSLTLAVSLVLLAFSTSLSILFLILLPFSVSCAILNTTLITRLTRLEEQSVGRILGTASVAEAVSRMIAPALSGILSSEFGPGAPAMVGAFLMGIVTCIFWVISDGSVQIISPHH
jgi:DHA1 family tetracycline resistance protein-like MFS transporter